MLKRQKPQWVKDAEEWALDRLEIIDDIYVTPDYVQIRGEIGGDVLSYRYYKDGTVVEK